MVAAANKMSLFEYEMKFTKGVHETHAMLDELDKATNDDHFWRVFGQISAGYRQLSDAMHAYYTLLRDHGDDTEHCSLTQELRYGLYLLDEKYEAILNKIHQVSH